MKKIIFLTIFAFLSISGNAQELPKRADTSAPIDKSKNITIFPAKLSFALGRGESISKSISIKNTTDTKYQLVMEFRDWTRDTIGKHTYLPIGTSKQSCAGWVTFDKPFVELAPGEATTVTVTMKVPDSAEAVSEMKWSMLLVKTASEKVAPTPGVRLETQIEQVFAIGIHILQTPPNISNKELKMLDFTALPGNGRIYRVICKNVGGVELSAKFSIEISSLETGTKITLGPEPAPLFPRQTRYVDFRLPADLPKGKYMAIALVDPDDDSVPIEAAESEISIK